MNHIRIRRLLILIGLFWLILFPLQAFSQIDCNTLPHWVALDNGVQMNQKHLFCGEWNRGRAKGFHSRPDGMSPDTVAKLSIQDKPNAAGIYTGRWSYQNHPEKNKFSSMFPNNCSAQQVLNSINYASSNSDPQCPKGAPNWTKCGQNKPQTSNKEDSKYCSKDGQFFTIGYAPPKNGKINTAFPIFQ
jgi:EndoU nuclease-like protein